MVCLLALTLGYSGQSAEGCAVLLWLVAPPLFAFTMAYLILDLYNAQRRKQAAIGALLTIPVALVIWHFRFNGI